MLAFIVGMIFGGIIVLMWLMSFLYKHMGPNGHNS